MRYQSNLRNVMAALDAAEERALTAVGSFVQGVSIANSPVDTGNLQDSNDFIVDTSEKAVRVGNSVDYAVHVHEGTSSQMAQPWLEDSVMGNVSRIKSLISESMRL